MRARWAREPIRVTRLTLEISAIPALMAWGADSFWAALGLWAGFGVLIGLGQWRWQLEKGMDVEG